LGGSAGPSTSELQVPVPTLPLARVCGARTARDSARRGAPGFDGSPADPGGPGDTKAHAAGGPMGRATP